MLDHLDGLDLRIDRDLLLELSKPHIVNGVNDKPTGFLFDDIIHAAALDLGLPHDLRLPDRNGDLFTREGVVEKPWAWRVVFPEWVTSHKYKIGHQLKIWVPL